MKEYTSCKLAIEHCISQKYFAIAHLYNEEKTMNVHIHDCYEIYYSISGGKQYLIDNKFYDIQPGDLFVINQFESHYLAKIDQMVHERIVLSIYPDFLKELSTMHTDLSSCFTDRTGKYSHKLSLSKEQQQRFLFFINKITANEDFGKDIIERAAFMELMLIINSIYLSNNALEEEAPGFQYNQQVEEIIGFINQHIYQPLHINTLTDHFHLSDSYLCRIFKSATGTTINKYINARRISIAKVLLSGGSNVTDVCEQCGFNDYSNFLKAFTKAVGLSPKKYAQNSNRII